MKTKEQVIEWLKSKEWYEQFKSNTEKHKSLESLLDVESTSLLFLAAFPWKHTYEGEDFWYEKHLEYLNWWVNEND